MEIMYFFKNIFYLKPLLTELNLMLIVLIPGLGSLWIGKLAQGDITSFRCLYFLKSNCRPICKRYSEFCHGLNYSIASMPLLSSAMLLYYQNNTNERPIAWGFVFLATLIFFMAFKFSICVSKKLNSSNGSVSLGWKLKAAFSNGLSYSILLGALFANISFARFSGG